MECQICASTSKEVYAINCKHMNVCIDCAKSLVTDGKLCTTCKIPIKKIIIKEFNVRSPTEEESIAFDKYYLGEYPRGTDEDKLRSTPFVVTEDQAGLRTDDGGSDELRFKATRKDPTNHFLLIEKNGEFIATALKSWVKLEKPPVQEHMQPDLEQAEKMMAERTKSLKTAVRRFTKKSEIPRRLIKPSISGSGSDKSNSGDDAKSSSSSDHGEEGYDDLEDQVSDEE